MHIDHQVGPNFVNIFGLMVGGNFFKENLYPRGHAHNDADIPTRRAFYNLTYLRLPIGVFGNAFSGFIKMLKTKGGWGVWNGGKMAFEVVPSFLQMRTSAYHQNPRFKNFGGEIVFGERHNLSDAGALNGFGHLARNGNPFGSRLGSA